MRFERLDLLCFGCFENKTINFPDSKSDLHIIYGPNEAGKSTAQSAIGNLLFGFLRSSSYNFRFDNKDLRIGAVVDNGKGRLTFRRRKGNKDTIVDEKDSPLSDSLLADLLQGVDRLFFERMFSLSHERLRKGGQEILDEKDDVGRTLFSASAGLSGLAELLKKLEKNADALWAPRKGEKRLYYQGREKYEDAEQRRRETTVLASNWKETRRQLSEISEKHSQRKSSFSEKTALREKLERIRRTLPQLVKIKKLEERISEIGSVPCFSKDADKVLKAAKTNLNQADAALKNLDSQIREAKEGLTEIKPDESILAREKDIEKLEEYCAIVDKHENDIPDREAEIRGLEKECHDLVIELGWTDAKIEKEDFFSQGLSFQIGELIEEKKSLEDRFELTNKALYDAENLCNTRQQEIKGSGVVPETAQLMAAIRKIREKGRLDLELKKSQDELSPFRRKEENSLKHLQPWTGSAEKLGKLSFPRDITIKQYDEEFRDLKDSKKEVMANREKLQEELRESKLKKEQLLRGKQAVASEQLEEARQHRNRGWDIIRRKYLEDGHVPDEEVRRFSNDMNNIAEDYEKSVKSADALADNRFVHAEETAQLLENSRMLEQLEQKLETLGERKIGLYEQENELEKRWQNKWKNCGFEPLSPPEMKAWIEQKNILLDDYEKRLSCEEKRQNLISEIEDSKNLLIQSLQQVGQGPTKTEDQSLHLLLDHAETIKSDLDEQSTRLKELRKQASENEQQRDKAKDDFDKICVKREESEKKWKDVLNTAGFPTHSSPKDVSFFLECIREIKEKKRQITEMRTKRIDAMKRDIEKFHKDVVKLSEELGFTQASDKETVCSLAHRLKEEGEKKSRQEERQKNLGDLEKRKIQEKEKHETAFIEIQPLLKTANTEDLSILEEQIAACDQLMTLKKEREEFLTELINDGDGKDRAELEHECENQDSDQVKASLASLESDIKELNETLQRLSEEKVKVTIDLEKISGGEDAAEAEADKEFALTDMGMAVEGYVKFKTAAILLQWGMEKFRKERQGPMLERASKIFKVLTLENFLELTVKLDDKDKLYLAGIRSDATHVGVEGMSDGTVDQLYLALRMAAIEEYVQKSQPLPFIADDLFINYDNDRAGAGFKVLSELSQKTQILFFTHHEHLVDVAKQTLSSDQFVTHCL